jgi:hypothetical protein
MQDDWQISFDCRSLELTPLAHPPQQGFASSYVLQTDGKFCPHTYTSSPPWKSMSQGLLDDLSRYLIYCGLNGTNVIILAANSCEKDLVGA